MKTDIFDYIRLDNKKPITKEIDNFFEDFLSIQNRSNYLAHYRLSLEHKINEIYVKYILEKLKDIKQKVEKDKNYRNNLAKKVYKDDYSIDKEYKLIDLIKNEINILIKSRIFINIVGQDLKRPARTIISKKSDNTITNIIIYYNKNLTDKEIRIHLGHELGHIILQEILKDKIHKKLIYPDDEIFSYYISYKIIKGRSDFYKSQSEQFTYQDDEEIKKEINDLYRNC